ncbi:MAG: lytic murein transglycosylase, partial [Marinibacterium sp.]|nr:lytic murein transglycosylase [Marinibacterium sp.]
MANPYLAGVCAVLTAGPTWAEAVEQSLRPVMRPVTIETAVQNLPRSVDFQSWVRAFRQRAQAAGISEQVLDAAFAGVSYDADVVRRDRNQNEFIKTIWDY